MEQNVDIPVPHGGGDRGGPQGFLLGQDSTAFCGADRDENAVPRSGGLQGSRPRQASSASSAHLPGVDEAFTVVFALFPIFPKCAGLGSHSGSELPSESSPSTRRAYAVPMVPEDDEPATESESEVEKDCDFWVDGAGLQFMRTAAFPARWYLLGTGFDGSVWLDEPG